MTRRRPDPAPGSADRRPRRRLDRGPLGLQRRDRRPGRCAKPHPGDLRRRPRDRHHARRLRRRSSRPDPDRRRRGRRSGARRTHRLCRRSGPAHPQRHAPAPRRAIATGCAPPPANCRARSICSTSRGSSSISPHSICRPRSAISARASVSPLPAARPSCARKSSPSAPLCWPSALPISRGAAPQVQAGRPSKSAPASTGFRRNCRPPRSRPICATPGSASRRWPDACSPPTRAGSPSTPTVWWRWASCSNSYSYKGVLARGFALVTDDTGAIVRSKDAVLPGTALNVEVADGGLRRHRLRCSGGTEEATPTEHARRAGDAVLSR